jgi:hypothetical protein
MRASLFLAFLLFGGLMAVGQSRFSLTQKWAFDSYGDDIGNAGLFAVDLNGNGKLDVIVPATITPSFEPLGYFSVMEFDGEQNTYLARFVSRVYSVNIKALTAADINSDNIYEIIVLFESGDIRIFDSSTFKEIQTLTTIPTTPSVFHPNGPGSITTGDIDNDGTINIVASFRDNIFVFNADYSLRRRFSRSDTKLILANVDSDPAIETILSSGSVIEFTGETEKAEVSFSPSPDGIFRIADMNNDQVNDVLYSSGTTVKVFNVQAKLLMRIFDKSETYGNVTDFFVHDYTADGIPDVFIGNEQFDVLTTYNGANAAFDFRLDDQKRNGLASMVIGELDGTEGTEILWSSGANCSCVDHIFVYDLATRQQEWMSIGRTPSFSGYSAFDYSASDGKLVIASQGNYLTYYTYGLIEAYDNEKKLIGKRTGVGESPNDPTVVKIGDVNNDGINEIVVGVSTSYTFSSVRVLDASFNYLKSFDIYGMSDIIDIEIADLNDDQKNEVIITTGTWVSGSTNPAEYQNYIYIFDGETGSIKFKSLKIAGIGSRAGNIKVGNIDNDPAPEIAVLRYVGVGFNESQSSSLHIIDGWTYHIDTIEDVDYSAIDFSDFDKDGILDIIAGTLTGKILAVSGETFEVKKEIATDRGIISSINAVRANGDDVEEYVVTNKYRVEVFDALHGRTMAVTDTLSTGVGMLNSVLITKNEGGVLEIMVNTGHTIYALQLESEPNVRPGPFALESPVDNTRIPSFQEWIEFDWQPSTDIDPIAYSFHLSGEGLDTAITQSGRTHVALKVSDLKPGVPYTWTVKASDGDLSIDASNVFHLQISEDDGDGRSEQITAVQEIDWFYSAFPNPFTTMLVVQNSSADHLKGISVRDAVGVEHLKISIDVPPGSQISVDGAENLPSGVYVVLLHGMNSTLKAIKVVKY